MSKLADIVPTFDATALPGYVISQPRLPEIAAAERYFARRYLAAVGRACRHYPPDAAEVLIKTAEQRVAGEWFSVGMPGFVSAAISAGAAGFLLYLALRVKHESMTPAKARELYRDGDEGRITEALFDVWGLTPAPAGSKKNTRTRRPRRSPSTGTPSTAPSAPPPPTADAA
jgi:hypothetical protein